MELSKKNEARMSVLEDVRISLESWSRQILDMEIKINSDLEHNIAESLQRQVLDGLISDLDSQKHKYVTNLWIKLYKTIHTNSTGIDGEILHYLLELLSLNEISKYFFIKVVLSIM